LQATGPDQVHTWGTKKLPTMTRGVYSCRHGIQDRGSPIIAHSFGEFSQTWAWKEASRDRA